MLIFKLLFFFAVVAVLKGPETSKSGTNSAPTFGTFFSETASNKQVPRALFVDLEPSVVGNSFPFDFTTLIYIVIFS